MALQFRCTSSIYLRKTRFYSVFSYCVISYTMFPFLQFMERENDCANNQSHVVAKKISHKLIVKGALYRKILRRETRICSWRKKNPRYILFIYYIIQLLCSISNLRFVYNLYDVISFAVVYCVNYDEYKIVSEIFSINDNVQFEEKYFLHTKIACIGRRDYETGVRPRRAAFSKLQIHATSP